MSELNAPEYYQRREQKERALAEAAVNPAIAAIHREMADRYSELIELRGHSAQPLTAWN